ncbi:ABC transporter permease [Gloeobacter violaceus]|uniref:Gll2427 protein n=1 Tax=Gloeobacter violaceus (strain ATCC 29082 / PCC 7421) TaxID=251221 RepID=Q7NHV8_GLOVI|nr:ABC transporter permease [Gloeobacter violaceus]BAC90368.1 gll2427 [Gloeobacter violaceus PCC 7421]
MDSKQTPSLAQRVYGRLLGILPAEFRREYGAEMLLVFCESYGEEQQQRNTLRLAFFWWEALADVLATACKQHLDALGQDLRYAARMLAKSPLFTVVAVLTLGLGIGATTAMFSFVNAVLLKPLPYPNAEQLVTLWESNGSNEREAVSFPNFNDWREQSRVFSGLAAYDYFNFDAKGREGTIDVRGLVVSANIFAVLGVEPAQGRAFVPAEDGPGHRVLVISHRFWQRHFGGQPGVVGKALNIGNQDWTVIGIMPAGFPFPDRGIDVWAPIVTAVGGIDELRPWLERRGARSWYTVARLKPGISQQEAQAQMTVVADRLAGQYPETNAGWSVQTASLYDQKVGGVRPSLLALFGMMVLVLLIACANVANLQLARTASRQKEMVIRAALGATRGRIIRQLLTENVLLALLGGALGVGLALWGVRQLLDLVWWARFPRFDEVSVDGTVLGFALAVATISGVLFGLAPARQALKFDLTEALKEGGRGTTDGRRANRFRGGLVVAEVALSMVLLVSAGLMAQSFLRLQATQPGFDSRNVLITYLGLEESKYPNARGRIAYFDRALDSLRLLPGVKVVAAVRNVPLDGPRSNAVPFAIEGRPQPPGQAPFARTNLITPDYFKAMAIPLQRGRLFTRQDNLDAPRVAIINRSMALQLFPNADPLGKRIRLTARSGASRWAQIVGVVGDVKQSSLESEAGFQIYVPYAQDGAGYMALILRTAGEPAQLSNSVRAALKAIDRDQAVANFTTHEQIVADSIVQPRLRALLVGIFAAVALLLVAIGLYGVIAYSVGQRSHEIGVRLALGALPGDIVRMVVGQGMALALVGIALGLAASLAVARLLTGLLFGVSAADPATYVALSVLLCGVALVACYVPARKAAKVDPAVAMRYE